MNKLLIGLSVGALVLAGGAYAAETQMGAKPGAEHTRAEAKARAEQMFDKMDLTKDGKLDKADRAARMGQMFDHIDSSKDGTISRDEFNAAHEKMGHGRMGAQRADGAGHRMGHHMGRGGMERGLGMGLIRQADPNQTGTITKDAFVGAALKMFDTADANKDGKVTREERRAAMREHMRGRMGHGGMGHGGMGQGPMGDMPPPPPAK